jgi:hypothetical protein
MKTVAERVSAKRASFWRDVFGGSDPRASRDISERGRRRSCRKIRES